MKKILFLFLCFSVWPVFAQNAIPFCMSMTTRVHVKTHIGNPKYVTSYSREEFLKKTGRRQDERTLGLTAFHMAVDTKVTPSVEQQFEQICVSISDLDVNLYYPDLTIYIDKKYAPSSCEYQVIKDHENYHVAVAQRALTFYKKDVENVVYDTLRRMSSKIVYSKEEVQPTVARMSDTITAALQPLLQHINAKLVEKNAAIDTPEMYEQTTQRCKNW